MHSLLNLSVILLMPVYVDQIQQQITLNNTPKRIVSLVPSQTELLYDLGLEAEVAGITKFCVHPEQWLRSKTRIGGTKNIHIDQVKELRPDLIIANKEENVQEQVIQLQSIAPVWTSDINTIDDALQMIASIGTITGRPEKGDSIVQQLKKDIAAVELLSSSKPARRTAYLIWKEPYMTVGADTFIHYILKLAGFENVFGSFNRYPSISMDDLRLAQPELVLLSSEPYPFKQKHVEELATQLPGTQILLADGEMFSWYGSRMLHLLPYLHGFLPQIN